MENANLFFLSCRLFGRKVSKISKGDPRRISLKDDSHFAHSKGQQVSGSQLTSTTLT